jgi:hypothetical protein
MNSTKNLHGRRDTGARSGNSAGMASLLRKLQVALALVLAPGCGEGVWMIEVDITIPAEVMAEYSEDARGRLLVRYLSDRADADSVQEVGIVCGGAEEVVWADGRDAMGNMPETTVEAWIEPLTGEDERPCGELEWDLREHFVGGAEPGPDEPRGSVQVDGGRFAPSHVSVGVTLTSG